MKKWLVRVGIVVLAITLAFGGYTYYKMRSMGLWRAPSFDTEAPPVPVMKKPAILVFSKTNAFIHTEAIPAAENLFMQLGEKYGWSVYVTENAAIYNPLDLAKFDTVVWNNVTGNVLTDDQRRALVTYLENGGGWIGIHAAGDGSTEVDWPWYRQHLIGAMFIGHPFNPQFQEAIVYIEATDDPIVSHLGESWVRTDEWYSFDSSPRDKGMKILAGLDESSYSPSFFNKDIRMGEDHPIIWKTCVKNKGRAFYSALGHTAESYSEPKHIEILVQAVSWSAGLQGEDQRAASTNATSTEPSCQVP